MFRLWEVRKGNNTFQTAGRTWAEVRGENELSNSKEPRGNQYAWVGGQGLLEIRLSIEGRARLWRTLKDGL